MNKLLLFLVLAIFSSASCNETSTDESSENSSVDLAEKDRQLVSNKETDQKESLLKVKTGLASYYADRFHGRKTASGDLYDQEKFTAAHRSLPFGTKVKVTNLRNGKEVVVEITDRGPFNKKRIIDLSKSAAKKIGMLDSGVTKVELELVNNN